MLDPQPVREIEGRRLAQLQPVPDDPSGAGLACRTMRRDVQTRPIGPGRHGHAEKRERRLVAEELPGSQARRIAHACPHERVARGRRSSLANAVERHAEVAAPQPCACHSPSHRIRDREHRGEVVGQRLRTRHPLSVSSSSHTKTVVHSLAGPYPRISPCGGGDVPRRVPKFAVWRRRERQSSGHEGQRPSGCRRPPLSRRAPLSPRARLSRRARRPRRSGTAAPC